MATKKNPRYEPEKEVRRLARKRVGNVPSSRVIQPKNKRKKPKHKKAAIEEE